MTTIFQDLPNFLLIFCRITSFFVVAPLFSAKNVPNQFKIGISFFVSLLVFLSIGVTNQQPPEMNLLFMISLLREILIGLIIGFVAFLFFSVVQIAGSFMDIQIGFSIANVMDPMTGTQSPIIGNFKYFVALLFFLAMNGHLILIQGIMNSYQWVPLNSAVFYNIYHGDVTDFLVQSFSRVFYISFQMAAPVIASIFFTDVALGILARTAPQFNMFVVGLPIKIIIGLFVLFLMISSFAALYSNLFHEMFHHLRDLMQILGESHPS